MNKCEVCGKEKTHYEVKDDYIKSLGFKNVDVYNCDCPIFMFDEIMEMREKKNEASEDDNKKFQSIIRQKKEFADVYKIYFLETNTRRKNYDNFHKEYNNLRFKDPNEKDAKEKQLYDYHMQQKIEEAKRIGISCNNILRGIK